MKTKQGQFSGLFSASDAVIGAAILTVVFAFLGVWLDGKLHSGPWLALIGTFLGMILGMVRMVIKVTRGMSLSKPPKDKPPPPIPFED